ncbi:PRD domain-containing protein [Dermatophilus congolensis]|uniref:Transcription antiterminator LicT n=1 Tax=Dermatophilus congolensis TaxID=1863 RepID=A0A239V8Q5_9MICO|nr:PRD domain-containing protein [Dermatophilus congolensis]MBO3130528.1 PRD domain-containing protein [Dermatophilus congolensis]MBO3130842.1 PRD domain-containing protein [Dermatophilus congolensis]MBO3135000.1 PRD domain-containing protein [Dermatophilus congolensis]MBO3137239.1 PRD domain-containing protein [Dermatophilus congolensis]MBO3139484.1 PRD domain-containing protein [Dermatophilus congolensis]
MGSQVTVRRVYNNNVVLGVEDGAEVVLLGKGIGFGRKPGDEVDTEGVQRFVEELPYKAARVADVLSGATMEETEVARAIVAIGRDALGLSVGQALLLPVLDHLSVAVKRVKMGITVDFPLRWEVGHVFPEESAAGREAMHLANARLGVVLQEDEWVAFALHFVNHRWAGGDLSRTLSMTETIRRSFSLLEESWGRAIDENSMNAARFVTHMRYLFVRALESRQLDDVGVDLLAPVRARSPEAVRAALGLRELVEEALGVSLTEGEVGYLVLHTVRLYAELGMERSGSGG